MLFAPLRYLPTDTSSTLAYASPEAARDRGASVTLVSGPVSLPAPAGVTLVPVQTTRELYDAMLGLCPAQQIIVQAAAPADYRPASPSAQKLSKRAGAPLTLELVENPDVARAVGERRGEGQTLIGFAAETNDGLAHAREKLERKEQDMIELNDVTRAGAGFGVDTNIVTLVTRADETELPLMSKREVAHRIFDRALELR